jgi:iron complex transport system ATP-binding protein
MANTPPYSDYLTQALVKILDSPTLSTKNLSIGIGGHLIATCDDLKLESGNVLALIGKNGSGKSTFLRTLSGILKPISGEISFGGQPQKVVKIEKIVAWLSQEEHLEFSWTVKEYVFLGRIAQNSGHNPTNADEEAVEEAIENTDCQELSTRFVHELSGGERQRVRIARALAQQTPLILMDEPTTHLDIEHQFQILWLIDKLAKQGKSIIVSLHDVVQAKTIGTQFLLFNNCKASISDELNKELLEQTLGVKFEQFESGDFAGLLFPNFCRTTG